MEKAQVELKNLLTRLSEEKIDLAGADQNESGSNKASWSWSAADNKSWSWENQSWQK